MSLYVSIHKVFAENANLKTGKEYSNNMKQGWLWIVIAGATVAAALYFGAPASTVLIVALLVFCCGGMMFGMGRMKGEHKRKAPDAGQTSDRTPPGTRDGPAAK